MLEEDCNSFQMKTLVVADNFHHMDCLGRLVASGMEQYPEKDKK